MREATSTDQGIRATNDDGIGRAHFVRGCWFRFTTHSVGIGLVASRLDSPRYVVLRVRGYKCTAVRVIRWGGGPCVRMNVCL